MNLGATEIIIIAVVVLLLFGAKKMPQMARSLGQSMRIIKAETKGMREDDQADVAKAEAGQPVAATPPAQLGVAKAEPAPTAAEAENAELKRQLAVEAENAELKRQLAASREQAQKNAG
ncbi:Sec-independent protein translocase subunit TatA [Actinokineospora bangkokensis]|uniref:Sec-independent protein translocase protein TatA n=1 Tax=Actinokineospora bangkokensis TaxID=1193682 RepID=A0A1Q9LN14_9PSEU|nr:Sec-independent protein translocase subunit TatA [Actinokineospora bangkokensis]OLR93436.1 hypothetical protein BJP25_14080 [Actinokineospora bangkokensis]